MDHAPIYRADKNRPPAPITAVRRSASLVTAVAALTISGVALGYHGFAPPGLDAPPAASQNQAPSIAVPVPIVALPLVNGGHPDLLAQLSSALVAPVQQVRAIVQPAPPPAPPPPLPQFTTPPDVLPEPLTAPIVASVDIAAPEDAAPATDDASDVIAPEPASQTPARLAEPVRLAPPAPASAEAAPEDLAAAAVDDTPPDPGPVEDAPAAPAPAPAPAASVPAATAKAAAPVQKAAAPVQKPAPPPAPEPKRVEVPREEIPKLVIVIPHDDPKPQAHAEDGPKPDAKKGPPPPTAPAAAPPPAPAPQPKDDHGDQGHNNNNGGGNNNGGNKGPGKGGHG